VRCILVLIQKRLISISLPSSFDRPSEPLGRSRSFHLSHLLQT
jgi:hypothetical protein